MDTPNGFTSEARGAHRHWVGRVCGAEPRENLRVTTRNGRCNHICIDRGWVGYGAAACAGDRRRVGRVGSKG